MRKNEDDQKLLQQIRFEQLKKSWDEQKRQHENIIHQEKAGKLLQTNTSLSAVVILSGEDLTKKDRIKKQQEDMRNWIRDQMKEKSIRYDSEKSYENNYDRMLQTLNEIRDNNEKEEKDMKKQILYDLLQENRLVSIYIQNFI